MNRKIAAVWVSLAMLFGFVVIVDIVTDFTPTVRATTLYVNETGSGGAFTSIQDAIDAANPGNTVFVYNGTYYENVVINKEINLIGMNRDNTTIDGGGSGDVVNVSVNRVNITEFMVTGGGGIFDAGIRLYRSQNCRVQNNKAHLNSYGIYLTDSSNNNVISGNIISDNSWDGIYLGSSSNNNITNNNASSKNRHGIRLKSSSHNNIIRNNFSSNDWYGIHLVSSDNNTITNNTLTLNNFCGIYLDLSSNNQIKKNNLLSNTVGIFIGFSFSNNITGNKISSHSPGIHVWISSNNTFVGNDFTDDGIYIEGYELSNYNSHEIIDNIVNGKPLYYYKNCSGIDLDGISLGQLILANCTDFNIKNLQVNNTDVGIEIAYSTNIHMTNNDISNNYWGIFLYSFQNGNITENNFSNNIIGASIRLSSNNTIKGNYVSSNVGDGMDLTSSSNDNIITNNTMSFNNIGIGLMSSTNNNRVSGNYIFNNYYGFYLSLSSKNNLIVNNTVLSNTNYGIYISSSPSNNMIYHNNLIDNNNQAYDGTNMGNQWDNGYPSGGNYWSDYTGVDLNSTPNQDTPPPDGIGDTAYVIDPNSQDNYPLMQPVDNYTILSQGWNLISLPLIQEDENLTMVLEMIDGYYNAVQWYDVNDIRDPWKHHKIGKPFGNDLFFINQTMGFWINITPSKGAILLHNGIQPTQNQTIPLRTGWNMVGYPSLATYNRTDGLNNLTFNDQVDAIWSYDAATQKWEEMGESEYFEIGKGYYIHAKSVCEWEVPL